MTPFERFHAALANHPPEFLALVDEAYSQERGPPRRSSRRATPQHTREDRVRPYPHHMPTASQARTPVRRACLPHVGLTFLRRALASRFEARSARWQLVLKLRATH